MTKQSDILNDSRYRPLLDHGFVGLVDKMGDDAAIVQAARVSYGVGTKTVNEDRGLIRYLVSKKHTSPLEMVEFKFHIKIPIFVMRQFVRHRTSSLNEYSARYSIMTDEFYIPENDVLAPQSKTNKQGRAGEISDSDKEGVKWLMKAANETNYQIYQALLGDDKESEYPFDPYCDSGEGALLSIDFEGLSRELARTVLPVSFYTSLYWKQDLHNLFHLIKLRSDPHAQYEIQVLANAIFDIIKEHVPVACEAFEDYVRQSKTFSRMELNLLNEFLSSAIPHDVYFGMLVDEHGSEKELAKHFEMTTRELIEFKSKVGL